MFSKLRSLIFKFDPETAHDLAIKALKTNVVPVKVKAYDCLKVKLLDREIPNPIGIAAGLSGMGLDPITSISGSITAVANVGPGMGDIIGPKGNFAPLPDAAKWLLSFGMLLGRLEILTLLVLFFPAFWRR